MQTLVLASTSPYRQALLERLQLPFITHAPNIDETPLPNETPEALVKRLSYEKAKAVAAYHPQAVIIGSDQVATLEGNIIGKPNNHENAKLQLRQSSGKTVTFLTGLTVLNVATGKVDTVIDSFDVTFRKLSDEQIESYLFKEKPYDCAGSFKSEGLGIVLFEEMKGKDPTSLIGLPLIALTDLLHASTANPLNWTV
jgi:MAF protein